MAPKLPSMQQATPRPLDGPCLGLRGDRYAPLLASYLEWGGAKAGARNLDVLSAELFPYKQEDTVPLPEGDYNRNEAMMGWTATELAKYNGSARLSSYWKLNWVTKAVLSVNCSGSGPLRFGQHICDACHSLTSMETFKRSLRKVSTVCKT
jgi:hypothetical protein